MDILGTTLLENSAGVVDIPVAEQAVVYTKAVDIRRGKYFGLFARAASTTGTPSIKVELQESYVLPATEGAADDNWAEPDGADDLFSNIADKVMHPKTVTPVPGPYMRLKITGLATNPADATIRFGLAIQENV